MNRKISIVAGLFNVFLCAFALFQCLSSCKDLKKLETLIEEMEESR